VALRYDPFEYDQIRAEVILQEHLVAVATPQFLEQHPQIAASRSLKNIVLLLDSAAWAGAPEFVEADAYVRAMNLAWTERPDGPQYNLASLTVSAALNHQGVAISRTALICDELKNKRLVNIFGSYAAAPARYIMLSRNPGDERVALFSRWLKEACRIFDKTRMDILEPSG
jgi:LysR family glycine cleavage system transcriptional activator